MNSRRHRVFGLVASAITAAALAVPGIAAAGSGGRSVGTSSPERPNPILLNDIRHFGNTTGLETPGAPIVVRVEGGFDWAAAGVGAVGGVGLVLVAGVGVSALRGRRRVDPART
jgi:hypothetical protein